MVNYRTFRAEVSKQLDIRDWTYYDLAKATGYEYKTIERFMGKKDNRPKSEAVALAIAKALNIPEHMAT